MTQDEVLATTGGKVVDEWESGQDIQSGWFKFDEVGKMIKGTLVGKRYQKTNNAAYKDQWVYELKTPEGIVNVGMSVDKTFVNNKMRNVVIGQIVAFKYTKDVPSDKFKGKIAKSLDVRVFGMDSEYHDETPNDDDIDVGNVDFNA